MIYYVRVLKHRVFFLLKNRQVTRKNPQNFATPIKIGGISATKNTNFPDQKNHRKFVQNSSKIRRKIVYRANAEPDEADDAGDQVQHGPDGDVAQLLNIGGKWESGADVMITNFCDFFTNFRRKNGVFSQTEVMNNFFFKN
jgi:hypothetical protein